MTEFFFDDWRGLWRTLLVGVLVVLFWPRWLRSSRPKAGVRSFYFGTMQPSTYWRK